MSYARNTGDCDLYIYFDGTALVCHGCLLGGNYEGRDRMGFSNSHRVLSTEEMAAHVERHIRVGHRVPDDVIPALREDDRENFPGRCRTNPEFVA